MGIFQRRHYEFIAQVIRDIPLDPHDKVRAPMASLFANSLAVENRRFYRERFYKACGVLRD